MGKKDETIEELQKEIKKLQKENETLLIINQQLLDALAQTPSLPNYPQPYPPYVHPQPFVAPYEVWCVS